MIKNHQLNKRCYVPYMMYNAIYKHLEAQALHGPTKTLIIYHFQSLARNGPKICDSYKLGNVGIKSKMCHKSMLTRVF